jgi:hypothetical protein
MVSEVSLFNWFAAIKGLMRMLLRLGCVSRVGPLLVLRAYVDVCHYVSMIGEQWNFRKVTEELDSICRVTERGWLPDNLIKAATLASECHPKARCYERSIVITKTLLRYGFTPRLIIGIQKIGGKLCGHAWVQLQNGNIVDQANAYERYVEAISWQPTKLQSPASVQPCSGSESERCM